jgi:hypothetical protein
MSQRQEVASETLRATPALVATAAVTVGGIPLSDWVMIATLIYIVLQIAYLLFRWMRLASQPGKRVDTESGE